jgi:hypothetical protein
VPHDLYRADYGPGNASSFRLPIFGTFLYGQLSADLKAGNKFSSPHCTISTTAGSNPIISIQTPLNTVLTNIGANGKDLPSSEYLLGIRVASPKLAQIGEPTNPCQYHVRPNLPHTEDHANPTFHNFSVMLLLQAGQAKDAVISMYDRPTVGY